MVTIYRDFLKGFAKLVCQSPPPTAPCSPMSRLPHFSALILHLGGIRTALSVAAAPFLVRLACLEGRRPVWPIGDFPRLKGI
jgi:hypothetical protein